jgi:hypothetical protein
MYGITAEAAYKPELRQHQNPVGKLIKGGRPSAMGKKDINIVYRMRLRVFI